MPTKEERRSPNLIKAAQVQMAYILMLKIMMMGQQ